ncbi:MAG: cytochrome c oxidase accessory protein CcoG [Alphaproteobacteria bacterium]|nr:cytochrome c oxidase accessory protein CcoG [Alphaproteobacteria bacterium]
MSSRSEVQSSLSTTGDIDRSDVKDVNTGAKAKGGLYAAREKIFPKRVQGTFRRLKWIIMAVTLAIYYITPWLRWDRGPNAPDQAVLLDMLHRRFYFFFIEIWPQEFYFVAGLLVMAGVGLFLVTSVVGRAWCGYSCPQTVWTDLFIAVESFFEGDRNARMKLDAAPYGLRKIGLRLAKHITWLVIAVATGGAWIFYFADAPTLLKSFVTGEAPFVAYGTVGVLTATTYIFGGLMREQVCIYMCPWPRIQAAMLDEDSLVVTYNAWRGEPRSRGMKKSKAEGLVSGDCVDCNACVAVCPTGIDIRHGQQMECITCALCIDACDDIMSKLGRQKGLIDYSTLRDYNHNMALVSSDGGQTIEPARIRDANGGFIAGVRHFDWHVILRPRTFIYVGLWSLVGLGMLFALLTRDHLRVNVLHDRNPMAIKMSDGSIRNGFTVKLLNMQPDARSVTLSIDGLAGAEMTVAGVEGKQGRSIDVPLQPDKLETLHVFVTVSPQLMKAGKNEFRFVASDFRVGSTAKYEASFETEGLSQ